MSGPGELPNEVAKELKDQLAAMVSYVQEFTNSGINAVNAHISKLESAPKDVPAADIATYLRRIEAKLQVIEERVIDLEQKIDKGAFVSNQSSGQPSVSAPLNPIKTYKPGHIHWNNIQARASAVFPLSVKFKNFFANISRSFIYAGIGILVVLGAGLAYFWGYTDTASSDYKLINVCQLGQPYTLIGLLEKIKKGNGLNAQQVDKKGQEAAGSLLSKLQIKPGALDDTDCKSLTEILFAYEVARWCVSNSCTDAQKYLAKSMPVAPTVGSDEINADVRTFVGCSLNETANACRIKVILEKVNSPPVDTHKVDGAQSTRSTQQQQAELCPYTPDPQAKFKAKLERIKLWVAAAAKAKGLVANQVTQGQTRFLEKISEKLQKSIEIKSWPAVITLLFQYVVALDCKNAVITSCPSNRIQVDRQITKSGFPDNMLVALNEQLPQICQVKEADTAMGQGDFKNRAGGKFRDFQATVLLQHIVQDPPK